jgi:soluble lytic murein transglycosylase-like protein
MKLIVAVLVFCVVYPAAREYPPFHKIHVGWASRSLLSRAEIATLVNDAARKHKLPPAFIASIIAAESAFQSDAVSPKGAVGLMQVMPDTASDMGLDAHVPQENVEAGTKYLAGLVNYYQKKTKNWLKRAIAAYNAGPKQVDRYRGVPPFRETQAYVSRVMAFYLAYCGSPHAFTEARR